MSMKRKLITVWAIAAVIAVVMAFVNVSRADPHPHNGGGGDIIEGAYYDNSDNAVRGDVYPPAMYTADACQTAVSGGDTSKAFGLTWTARDCKVMRQANYLREHHGVGAAFARDCRYGHFRKAIEAAYKAELSTKTCTVFD